MGPMDFPIPATREGTPKVNGLTPQTADCYLAGPYRPVIDEITLPCLAAWRISDGSF
ncbi:MAG: hypothetical protein ACUVQG_12920 [Thermogutta sp.]